VVGRLVGRGPEVGGGLRVPPGRLVDEPAEEPALAVGPRRREVATEHPFGLADVSGLEVCVDQHGGEVVRRAG
jgi:hypothetical protein